MKVTKDFWGTTTGEVFELTVEVEGKVYSNRYARNDRDYGQSTLPLDVIQQYMRRELMAAIEKDLFKGVR